MIVFFALYVWPAENGETKEPRQPAVLLINMCLRYETYHVIFICVHNKCCSDYIFTCVHWRIAMIYVTTSWTIYNVKIKTLLVVIVVCDRRMKIETWHDSDLSKHAKLYLALAVQLLRLLICWLCNCYSHGSSRAAAAVCSKQRSNQSFINR